MKQYIILRDLEKTLYGRSVYTEDGALSLCWSLSGFGVRVCAERAIIHFTPTYKDDQPAYVQLTLDDHKTKYAISTGKEKILLEDLGGGEHTVKLIKLSEGEEPLNVAAIELFGEDCKVLEAPKLPELRIEFFGDSITCGYGILSDASVLEHRYYEQDPTITYAGLTAEALGADIRAVSISGQGIVNDWSGHVGLRIPEFFKFESRRGREQHDFTTWIPHVVVVNAGTNDNTGGVSVEDYRDGVNAFLNQIREVYPEAHIFWAYGMMGNRYDAMLSELFAELRESDPKMIYVPIRPIYECKNELGANGHPNAAGNVRAAKILTAAIRETLGI